MWKTLEYDSRYEVSDSGQLRSNIGNPKIRKLIKHHNGYYRVTVGNKNYTIHRLVYETFVCKIPKGYEINHKDGNKANNRLDNLEMVTHKENITHAMEVLKTGSRKRRNPVVCVKDGKVIKEYDYPDQAAKDLGVKTCRSRILQCAKGQRKTYHGYQWFYLSK